MSQQGRSPRQRIGVLLATVAFSLSAIVTVLTSGEYWVALVQACFAAA